MLLTGLSTRSGPCCRSNCGVGPHCSLCAKPRISDFIVDAHKPVGVQALGLELVIQVLDEGVVGGLPRSGEIERDVALIGPEVQITADELAPEVDPDGRRQTDLLPDLPFSRCPDDAGPPLSYA